MELQLVLVNSSDFSALFLSLQHSRRRSSRKGYIFICGFRMNTSKTSFSTNSIKERSKKKKKNIQDRIGVALPVLKLALFGSESPRFFCANQRNEEHDADRVDGTESNRRLTRWWPLLPARATTNVRWSLMLCCIMVVLLTYRAFIFCFDGKRRSGGGDSLFANRFFCCRKSH